MKSKKKKTALVLGGGGSRGAYEAGVWQALTELGIEIDIVTGTSVGAINAAMVVQGDVDLTAQLWREIETHMVFDVPEGSQPIEYAREIVFHHGAGTSRLKELLDTYIDENQIRSAAMDYGIPVVSLPAFEAHYLFKEDIPAGRLTDYIVASASAFPAIHSYEIDGVDYIDGGYADEIPVNMAMQKGATHVIAVNLKGMGLVKYDSIKKAPNLVYIEPKWDLGNILIFDRANAKRIMRLGYLDTMKALGLLDGSYFAFAKGTFDKATLKAADACARVFDLDPLVLYTREIFLEKISSSVQAAHAEAKEAFERYRSFSGLSGLPNPKELLADFKAITGQHIPVFLIAYSLKEKGASSLFLSRAALRLLPEQIHAARFLVKYELV